MTASEFAALLHARKHHSYWMASCPLHGKGGRDKNPSLSIRSGGSGVWVHCFAGCDTRSILREMGLTFRDLGYDSEPNWRARVKPMPKRVTPPREKLGPLEATYSYTDADGKLVAQKLRYAGKVFLWRTPVGNKWTWRVDRGSLPLYRLHKLKAAPSVCLTEGEKDVHSLEACGFVATTAPNGVNSWRKEYAEAFRDKVVWIFPDNDKPGEAYAAVVAKDIKEVAISVAVISVVPYKDVSDYLTEHSPSWLVYPRTS